MSLCKSKGHKFVVAHHTRTCTRCDLIERVESCQCTCRIFEPAGVKNPTCGYFIFDPRASLRALWDQYRLSRAFQPGESLDLMEFRIPSWFRRDVYGS